MSDRYFNEPDWPGSYNFCTLRTCLYLQTTIDHQKWHSHIERRFFFRIEKKTLRSSQDSNLGPLNSSQMLSVWFSGWISLRLGKLWLLLKYFVLPPANWVIAAATLYVPSEPPFIGGNRKHFSFRRKVIQSAYTSLRLWNVSVEDRTLTCSNNLLWASWGMVMLN